jgi:23S rRNA (adenine1618-N6)-methyltransferase
VKDSSLERKPGLHPRNPHGARYDFDGLVKALPELAAFVITSPRGEATIDFADPRAVKALNRALLVHHYGIAWWDIPPGYLCPPIPGRADYIHHLADLLSEGGPVPTGPGVRILDIGTGANGIYPILGSRSYGWSFVGSDIDAGALKAVRAIVASNPALSERVEIRRQEPGRILQGLVRDGERFDACLCNPPFHASPEEARAGSQRKWRNLGKGTAPVLNFGGRGGELWCEGGEQAFLLQLIEESHRLPEACRWFTSLVSREESLASLRRALSRAHVKAQRVIPMAQGQKKSRILAWSYLG